MLKEQIIRAEMEIQAQTTELFLSEIQETIPDENFREKVLQLYENEVSDLYRQIREIQRAYLRVVPNLENIAQKSDIPVELALTTLGRMINVQQGSPFSAYTEIVKDFFTMKEAIDKPKIK